MEDLKIKYSDILQPNGTIAVKTFDYKGVSYVRHNDFVKIMQYYDDLDELEYKSIERLEKKLLSLSSEVEQLKKRRESNEKKINDLKKDVSDYERIYGKYVSPNQLILELWKGGVMKYMHLNKRDKLKIKISQKQWEYWTNIFLDLKICKRTNPKGELIAMVNREEAHEALYAFNFNLVPDNISGYEV